MSTEKEKSIYHPSSGSRVNTPQGRGVMVLWSRPTCYCLLALLRSHSMWARQYQHPGLSRGHPCPTTHPAAHASHRKRWGVEGGALSSNAPGAPSGLSLCTDQPFPYLQCSLPCGHVAHTLPSRPLLCHMVCTRNPQLHRALWLDPDGETGCMEEGSGLSGQG